MPQTRDRGYFAPEQLGPTQSLTPEGFLLCERVPIARTGELTYGDGETPIDPGPDGSVRVRREADDLFAPVAIASFEGKPVTLDHPPAFVDPSNWQSLAVGVVQNVRRGDGIEDDLMLADLLITDARAIEEVRAGLREVSNGYEADYLQDEPGRGRQTSIVGNHVALVERGRCGPRCAIGDSMKPKKRTVFDRLMAAFRAKDEEAFKAELEEAKDELEVEKPEPEKNEAAKDAPADFETRLAAIEAEIAKLVASKDGEALEPNPETNDEDELCAPAKVGDAIARAEILSPGIAAPAKATAKALDSLKAAALAGADPAVIKPFGDVVALKGSELDAVFIAASELAKARNNGKPARAADARTGDTIADINARNRAFWNHK